MRLQLRPALLAGLLIGFLSLPSPAGAENWPCWRGPRGDGTSQEKEVRTNWDVAGALWKTAMPGSGHASAIVWGNRVFTITALPEKLQRMLVSFDRDTGKVLWQQTVVEGPLEKINPENSYASGTPATDGKRVFVAFRVGDEIVVAAHDAANGKQLWLVRPGTHVGEWGFSNEPVLYKDKVIVDGDSKGNSFLTALSQEDGQVLWRVNRTHRGISYSAPLVREMAGRVQLIQCGDRCVASFDPDTGKLLWTVDGPSEEFVATPFYDEKTGLVFISSSWPQRHLLAIRPDGRGNVTRTNVAWRDSRGAPYIPSFVVAGDLLFSVNSAGVAFCYEAATGKVFWQERLGRHHASPVLAGGLVFFINDKGEINVIRPGTKFDRVARYELGEPCYASPAISGGQVFLRGFQHLFCIGKPAAADLAPRESKGPRGEMVLWYRQPAGKWLEAMPLGNGILGAMVFGAPRRERIALNECTFWSGRPHDYNDPEALEYFPQIRDLVFAGKFQEAEKMADRHFWGVPAAQQAYQPLGDLLLSFDGVEKAADYRRELNMETGVATVRYRAGDAVFTRETFVSYPDRVMVVRVAADKPGRVSVESQLKSPYLRGATAKPGKLIMEGCWKGPIPGNNWLIAPVEGEGVRFQAVLLAFPEGGRSEAADARLRVQGADAVTFLLTAATSFVNYRDIGGDPAAACEKILAAGGKDYAALRRRHEADFRTLMNRVRLDVGDRSRSENPTDERLRALGEGATDPNLEALCFQFGRYLLVSSSRAGGQPANLQGIWNESVSPPWGSKWTININTQMNYWLAEVCNLSECHQPLFDLLKDISVTGAKTAKTYYGCNGWVAHHNIDLWRGTAPTDAARFGMWPVGGAWLCQHLWEHYAFTGDKEFLRAYYPIMKGAAQFLLEVMVEEPKHHLLVTPFSMSPEHGYYDANGKMAFLSPSPTMDVAILRELFPHCIAASKLLGVDEEFRGKLEAALTRVPPYQINRLGHLQEWIEDWKSGPQGHNVSPNFTFYPGNSITLRRDPPLAAAIARWMENRRGGGGWPSAWDLCVWARLERGDRVGAGVQTFVRNSLAPNLHNRGANQSDASFGFTAAVAEALVQSHAGEISLLPALPAGWNDGSVKGLRARGGFEVDMQWKGGRLRSAELRNTSAAACKVRYGTKTAEFSLKPGEAIHLNPDLTSAN